MFVLYLYTIRCNTLNEVGKKLQLYLWEFVTVIPYLCCHFHVLGGGGGGEECFTKSTGLIF